MDNNLKRMVHAPDLEPEEEIVHSSEIGSLSGKGTMICIVTNNRLLVGGIKGKEQQDIQDNSIDLEFNDIRCLRDSRGFVSAKVIIETDSRVINLPKMKKENIDEVLDAIVEAGGFVKSEWEEEGQSSKEKNMRAGLATTLAGFGIIGTLIASILGMLLIMMGFVISLSIIGAIIGIPLILAGVAIIYVSIGLGSYGIVSGVLTGASISDGKQEWVHPESIEDNNRTSNGIQ